MTASTDKTDRNVIPRWRTFRVTAALGELGTPSKVAVGVRAEPADTSSLNRLVEDWEENRSLSFAADLVGGALVRGMPEVAREAAEFIVALGEAAPASTLSVARAVLGLQTHDIAWDIPTSPNPADLGAAVSRFRRRLRDAPRNPTQWVDLARAYTLLGQSEPAVRAMHTALALAPNNRFVLRSAARLLLHVSNSEQAYDMLRSAEATRVDPWLLAAEIAVASTLNREPRFIREGERLLREAKLAPLHSSELASAIGTINLMEGRLRLGRQYFRQALRLPTDNALAQAQWIATNRMGLALTTDKLDTPRSFEARSLTYQSKGEWSSALEEARKWLYDEPFSRNAAASASYLASVPLDRNQEAADLAKLGLTSTPHDRLLLNNRTFALASAGDLDEAERVFAEIGPADFESPMVGAYLSATRGLLLYRRGNVARGHECYERAAEKFRAEGDQLRLALALYYHAREALLASTPDAEHLWNAAQEQTDKVKGPEVSFLRRRPDASIQYRSARPQ